MGFITDKPLAFFAAAVGTIEDRQMALLQVRRFFERHCAAAVFIGGIYLLAGEAQFLEEVEIPAVVGLLREAQGIGQEFFTQGVLVESETDIKNVFQIFFDLSQFRFPQSLGFEGFMIDEGGLFVPVA